MNSAKWTLLTRILVCALLATTIAGCSVGRANRRISYWTKETAAHIPPGTSLEDAQAFFASHGLNLRCCDSDDEFDHPYFAMERHIGQFFLLEYDAIITVEITPDRRVGRVHVTRIGVGL
jgi:hypothetical protein